MELEVRRVSGKRTCFVSLPLHVIYVLQEREGVLPSFLALDIRLVDRNQHKAAWCLAWAGASSKSSCLEVPDKLAECIGLPDGARVRMKVCPNVNEAISVSVEPVTEDDWEILELNAEYLEDNFLSKVGVVQAGQHFPVWMQGEMVLLLKVISTKPNSVVKLVQGTELIVAPKIRQSRIVPTKDILAHGGKEAIPTVEPYFRIQEMDPSMVGSCSCEVRGLSVVLTTAIFISPYTAKAISLTNRQFVVLAGLDFGKAAKDNVRKNPISQESLQNGSEQELLVKQNIVGEKGNKSTVLQVIFWTRVARGHVMLPNALQLLLGVKTHSRVKLKPYNHPIKQSPSLISICPIKFVPIMGSQSSKVNMVTRDLEFIKSKNLKELAEDTTNDLVSMNWSKHVQVLAAAAACNDSSERVDHEGVNDKSRNLKSLLSCWLAAQLAICSKFIPENDESNILVSREAIMCFQLKNLEKFLDDGKFLSLQQIEPHDNVDTNYGPFPFYSHQGKMLQSHFVFFLLSVQSEGVGPNSDGSMPKYLFEARDQSVCFFFNNHLPFGGLPNLDINSEAKLSDKVVEVQLGHPLYLAFEKEILERETPTLDAINWLKKPAVEALSRLKVLLSPIARESMKKLGTPFPGGVMLHGPHACGKSRLALALAQELEKDVEVLAHRVILKCAELLGEQDQFIRRSIQKAVAEAVECAPSLIILDDLDALVPVSDTEGSEPSISIMSLSEFIADVIDAFQVSSEDIGSVPVAFLATSRAPSAVHSCLRSSGRFDYYVELLAPAVKERTAILLHAVDARGVICDQSVLEKVAARCDGYDTSDLEVLVDRCTHAAAARYISNFASKGSKWRMAMVSWESLELNSNDNTSQIIAHNKNKKFKLLNEDFDKSLENFVPATMRGISKVGKEGKCGGWEDVGGLKEVCHILQEMLELPLKHGKLFSNAPLRLRSGVLLYGPPGCGKTHLVGAAVAATSLRFISVKGPELLNKYIGASEQGVRDLFTKAAISAPCVLFFDEFDAIAPRRGHDNTGVTDRVVNQLLTELDGVEALNGVFVFAATSRPDLIDAALLRPGRLDRLLYCDFPSYQERLEILQILGRKLHLEEDVGLHTVAEATEGFSGADLQAVLSDAQLESVHSFLDAEQRGEVIPAPKSRSPCLTMQHLMSVVLKARPSVPEAERRRLANIYNAFRGGRSPGSSKQLQDAKGKKATLA